MKVQIIISIKIFFFFTVLTGIIYPILITGFSQLIFKNKSNGSFIDEENKLVGSALIAQNFDSVIYFQSRPSAISYNPMPSGGSNFGMTSKKLKDAYFQYKVNFISKNNLQANIEIPHEMLFTSASGVDPHISLQAARLQTKRIAVARNLNEKQILQLIKDLTENRQFFILGEPRINVLMLNLGLDKISK